MATKRTQDNAAYPEKQDGAANPPQKQDDAATPPQKQDDSTYASRNNRISKEDLYVLLALFMEDFPLETEEGEPAEQGEEKKYRKVGAALVLPNDKIFAIDCSRNGVHGVARLLMEHQDVVKDCKIFVSRKPCSLCTKLLVQSKVKEIFYLPIEPEYHQDGQETEEKKKAFEFFQKEKLRVDELFRVSAISQKVFVPGAGLKVVKNTQKYEIPTEQQQATLTETLLKYWNKDWLKTGAQDNLPWPSFDEEMQKQIDVDLKGAMGWAAKIALIAGSTKIACKFQRYDPKQKDKTTNSDQEKEGEKLSDPKKNEEVDSKQAVGRGKGDETETFDPENNETDRKQATVFITLARFLAERTDDPKTGVGAVIVDKNRKVVGLGWNGFPTKAVYGQFPRTSDDGEEQGKKYSYIIHAEQNALLMRNTKSITGGILFVTKIPCHECTPLLEMQGIKTVVLDRTKLKNDSSKNKAKNVVSGTKLENEDLENEAETVVSGTKQENKKNVKSLDYENFKQKMEKGVFNCFEMKSVSGDGNDKPGTS